MKLKKSYIFCTLMIVLASCRGGDTVYEDETEEIDPVFSFNLNEQVCAIPETTQEVDPLSIYAWHLSPQATYSVNIKNFNLTGRGIKIAVSDNGTEVCHEDLSENIAIGLTRNYQSNNPLNWPSLPTPAGSERIDAHGTAVAGLIAARANNGLGSRGIASEATIVPFRYVGTNNDIRKDIDQANGPFDIFNYSYGRTPCRYQYLNQSFLKQIEYGAKSLRDGKGALYVKASGNDFFSYHSDCIDTDSMSGFLGNANFELDNNLPYMIIVGAYNRNGVKSSYSTPGSSLWISGPAGEYGIDSKNPAMITTDLAGCDKGMSKNLPEMELEESDCKYTFSMNGTSAATPVVSGAIALLLQQNQNLKARDIKHILAKTARKIDNFNQGYSWLPVLLDHTYERGWTTNKAGNHFHNWYGFGILDIDRALNYAKTYTKHLPTFKETNFISSGEISLTIPDNLAEGVEHTLRSHSEGLSIEAVQIAVTIMSDDGSNAIQDIGIELTSPSGTVSQILYINSRVLDKNLNNATFLSNAFYEEMAQGNWTIKVIDGSPLDTAKLINWKIKFFGHHIDEIGEDIQLVTSVEELNHQQFSSTEVIIGKTKSSTISYGGVSVSKEINLPVEERARKNKFRKINIQKNLKNKNNDQKVTYQSNNGEDLFISIEYTTDREITLISFNGEGQIIGTGKLHGKNIEVVDIYEHGENILILAQADAPVFDLEASESKQFRHGLFAVFDKKMLMKDGKDIYADTEVALPEIVKSSSYGFNKLKLIIEKLDIPNRIIEKEISLVE